MKTESFPPQNKTGQTLGQRHPTLLDYYVATIPWLNSLIWPLFVLIIALALKNPLHDTLDQFPLLLDRSSKITLRDIEFEVESAITSQTSDEIRKALSGLPEESFFLLISLGTPPKPGYASAGRISSDCFASRDQFIAFWDGLQDLIRNGLVTISEYSYGDCIGSWQWSWTTLGQESHQAITEIIVEKLSEAWQ